VAARSRINTLENTKIDARQILESCEALKLYGFELESLVLMRCRLCVECGEGKWGLYVAPHLEAELEEGEPHGVCFGCNSAVFINEDGIVRKESAEPQAVLARAGIGKGK
jgi:hypothetical protein